MASPGGYGGLSWKADLNSGLLKTSRGEITSLRHDNNVPGEAKYGDTVQFSNERKIKSHGELIDHNYEDTSFRLNSPIYVRLTLFLLCLLWKIIIRVAIRNLK